MSTPVGAGRVIASVRVLHNNEGVSQGRWTSVSAGYNPASAELSEVWQVRLSVPLSVNESIADTFPHICERIWELTNADPDMLVEEMRAQATDYRAARVRSLSIGDVVIVKAGDIEQAFAVDTADWRQVELPAAEQFEKFRSYPFISQVNGSNPK